MEFLFSYAYKLDVLQCPKQFNYFIPIEMLNVNKLTHMLKMDKTTVNNIIIIYSFAE